MRTLYILNLHAAHVDGSIQELQDLELIWLAIQWTVEGSAVKAPLHALQQMRSLMFLGLKGVDVQGSVAGLANLSLVRLSLVPLNPHQVTGSVQFLRAMPLWMLELWKCSIDGPMGVLGTLRLLETIAIAHTSIHGSLHALLGLPDRRKLTLNGLHIEGELEPLPSDLPFAAQIVDFSYLSITGAIPPFPSSIVSLKLRGNT